MANFKFSVSNFLLLLAALLPLFCSSCASVDAVTGQHVYNMYSLQQDVRMGQDAMNTNLKELKKQGVPIDEDQAKMAEIRDIVNRIAAVSDMPGLPYEVHYIQNSTVNAAAMPGGEVMVFEGLFNPTNGLVKDNDELAAVLAHEIAHVNCRHSTERLSMVMTTAIGTEIIAAVLSHNQKDDYATALRSIFAVGTVIWIPTYTRTDEYEADRVGLFYMAKAGFDPRAAPRIWKRVSEKADNKDKTSIFSTHPGSTDRYKALEKLVPYAMEDYKLAAGSYPPGYTPSADLPPFDWRTVKKP